MESPQKLVILDEIIKIKITNNAFDKGTTFRADVQACTEEKWLS